MVKYLVSIAFSLNVTFSANINTLVYETYRKLTGEVIVFALILFVVPKRILSKENAFIYTTLVQTLSQREENTKMCISYKNQNTI